MFADFPQVGSVHGIVVQATCLHHTTEKLSGDMGRYYIDIEKKQSSEDLLPRQVIYT